MKTNRILTIALAAVFNLGGWTATPSLAADAAATVPPARQRIFQRIADKLNLSGDQRTQIKTALSGEKDTLQPMLARLRDARKNLRAAIQAPGATGASVRSASAQVADVEADLAVERMKIYGKIAPILTDEQRRKMAEWEQRTNAAGGRSGD